MKKFFIVILSMAAFAAESAVLQSGWTSTTNKSAALSALGAVGTNQFATNATAVTASLALKAPLASPVFATSLTLSNTTGNATNSIWTLDADTIPDAVHFVKYGGVMRSFSIGQNNTTGTDEEQVTIGNGNINTSEDGHILGENSMLTNTAKIAIGYDVDVDGQWSWGIGTHLRLLGEYSAVIGEANSITGTNSWAIGRALTNNANNEMHFGLNNTNKLVLGTNTLTVSNINLVVVGDASVNDEAYGAGWNGSTGVPTKNAVYDKIETVVSGAVDTNDFIAATNGLGVGTTLSNITALFFSGNHSIDQDGKATFTWAKADNAPTGGDNLTRKDYVDLKQAGSTTLSNIVTTIGTNPVVYIPDFSTNTVTASNYVGIATNGTYQFLLMTNDIVIQSQGTGAYSLELDSNGTNRIVSIPTNYFNISTNGLTLSTTNWQVTINAGKRAWYSEVARLPNDTNRAWFISVQP